MVEKSELESELSSEVVEKSKWSHVQIVKMLELTELELETKSR